MLRAIQAVYQHPPSRGMDGSSVRALFGSPCGAPTAEPSMPRRSHDCGQNKPATKDGFNVRAGVCGDARCATCGTSLPISVGSVRRTVW